MKTLTILGLGFTVAALAMPASAGQLNHEKLNQCKADLGMVYGDARIKLKSLKRVRGDQHLRLQIIPGDGDNSFVTCWVDRDGVTHAETRDGQAIALPPSKGEELLSQRD